MMENIKDINEWMKTLARVIEYGSRKEIERLKNFSEKQKAADRKAQLELLNAVIFKMEPEWFKIIEED